MRDNYSVNKSLKEKLRLLSGSVVGVLKVWPIANKRNNDAKMFFFHFFV